MLKKIWHDTVWSKVIANAIWEYRKDIILVLGSICGLGIVSYVFDLFKVIGQWFTDEIQTPRWLLIVALFVLTWKLIDLARNIQALFKERFRDRFKERDEAIKEARNELEDIKHLLDHTSSPTSTPARKTSTIPQPWYGFQGGTGMTSKAEPVDRLTSTPAANVTPTLTPESCHIRDRILDYLREHGRPEPADVIAFDMHLALPTIKPLLRSLTELGLVQEDTNIVLPLPHGASFPLPLYSIATNIDTEAQ